MVRSRRGAALAVLFLALCAWLGGGRSAATPVYLNAALPGPDLLARADAAPGNLTFAQVRAPGARFVPFAQVRRAGWPVSLWLRFSITGTPPINGERWLITVPRVFESAQLYRVDGSVLTTGMYVPFSKRPEKIDVPAFRVEPADYNGAPLYLRLAFYPEVPPGIRLVTEHELLTENESFRIVEGVFVGVLLAVAFFNLFLFAAARDRSALLYVVYVGAMIVNEIATTGLGEEFVWPGVGLNVRVLGYITSFAAFTAFLFFERSFLQTREQAPRCDLALIGVYISYAVLQILQASVPGGQVLVPALLFSEFAGMVTTIVVAVIRLRSGYRPARYFAIAFAPAMIGVLVNLLYDAFLPAGHWFWAANGVEIGTMLQSIVLSFSVIDRVNLLQSETRRTRTQLTAVSEHAEKMQALALYDPLTGLSNRIRFTGELNRTITLRGLDGKPFAVLFCDLDGFKAINDDFGHRAGDEVLKVVASRLASSLRGRDLIARLGGDEFAVLLEFADGPQADHVAAMLAHLLDEPIVLGGLAMPIGISVGRAVFPDEGRTMDELLHVADMRMYRMKQGKKAAIEAS